MARVVGNIPNFINGVSQQPPAIRLPSQAEAQVNCYSTVAKGLIPRPSLESVAKIADSNSADSFVHFIDRDVTERYSVVYDEAHSNTSPNLLTTSEQIISNWANGGASVDSQVEHSVDFPSLDGFTDYTQIVFNGTSNGHMDLENFETLAGSTEHTFSIWLRLRTDTALTDTDNRIEISGADVSATATQSINALVYNTWTKAEVTATSVASPTGSALRIAVRCDEAVTIDVMAPQFEVGDTATFTVFGASKPRLKVFDLDGVEQQVWIPDGEAYLEAASSPSEDIKALTVADYTIFENNKVTVAEGSTVTPDAVYEAYIIFDTIQPGRTYTVRVDAVVAASVTPSDTVAEEVGTAYQAELTYDRMVDASGVDFSAAPWSVEVIGGAGVGNTIYLKNTSTDFNVTVRDDSDGEGIRVVKRQVQTFGQLPRTGKEGSKVEVRGNADSDWASYWVEFDGNDGTDGINTWSETVGINETVDFDDTTMPHIMTRNASGTFTFRQGPWADRLVGDSTTNARPSFVGEQIRDIFFTDGRLGFLAGENVILSQVQNSGEGIFNFWRSSVTSLLDGDPIDVSSTHTKVSILNHAVPYQEQLLLFSDQTQFRLTKGNTLSPKTVGIEPLTEFESSRVARPAAVGNFVYFAVEKSDNATVREYYLTNEGRNNDAREITGHVPEYIPSDVVSLRGTSNEDFLIVQAGSEDDTFYCYKFFWSGEQKVQSAWFKWTFPDVTKVLGFHFFEGLLYLLTSRADGVFLEKMELDTGAQDDSNTGYNLSVDRKIISSDSRVSAVYDAGTDRTTYTFSDMTWKSVPRVIGINGNSNDYPEGYEVSIVGDPTSYDANTIIVEGDSTGDDFLFGIPVDKTYTLSEIHVRASNERGSKVPIAEGRLQLQRLKLVYSNTGYFKVTVTQEGRDDPKVYIFTGRNSGEEGNVVNALPIESGVFSVPIMSKNDRVVVTVSSDSPLPFRLLSADWTGVFHARGKRI